MGTLLDIQNLSLILHRLSHDDQYLLDKICLKVPEHKKVGLLGESGSGKTLLCKALLRAFDFSGLKLSFLGEINYKNRNVLCVTKQDMQNIRCHEWAFLPQDPISFFDPLYTIQESCIEILSARFGSSNIQELKDLLQQELISIGLLHIKNILFNYPRELSRGTLQRIACALCLAKDPQLLIADEPTSALDVISKVHILERLQKVGKTSILIASHDHKFLEELTDTNYEICGGKIR